ncbi:MAG: DUF2652 domain-containing protein [Bacteroidota bacterium]|nr:DUF2652 domain-containing protein [Ferruginibacter sp.]
MKGLIIIPDFTGFTGFVKNIDIELGVSITSELINTIIDNNTLGLVVSEIEGDAVLFFKLGEPVNLTEVFDGLKIMHGAFNRKLRELSAQHHLDVNLSLKFIVHYGELSVYDIQGFKKLFGQTVIEAHSLLKNGAGQTNYILLTQDYISSNSDATCFQSAYWKYNSSRSTMVKGLRSIDYSFYTYAA